MSNNVVHFAINAVDCERAKTFYENVFDWKFEPWGPPEFWRIFTSESGIHGALQKRREDIGTGGAAGYDCTIGVEDIEEIVEKILNEGGKITYKPFVIEHVGTVAQFEDTEGNKASVMQYLPEVS